VGWPSKEIVRMSSLTTTAAANINPLGEIYDDESSQEEKMPNDLLDSKNLHQDMEMDGTEELSSHLDGFVKDTKNDFGNNSV